MAVDFDLPPAEFNNSLDGLPLGDALKAAVLGEAYANPGATASLVRSTLGTDIEVMRCEWTLGVQRLYRSTSRSHARRPSWLVAECQ